MKRRSLGWLIAFGVWIVVAAGNRARAEDAVIVEQRSQWEMAWGVFYRVSGRVQNKSAKPLHYVKLQLDLLDANGKSVYTFVGYNQKAEALGEVAGEGADTLKKTSVAEKLKKIEPLKPGEKDNFRLGVSKDDIPKKPKFKTYSLKVVEVK